MIAQPRQHSLDFAPPSAPSVPLAPQPAGVAPPAPAAAELWAAVQFAPDTQDATPAQLEARRDELIARAYRFTPRVAPEPPDALLLELAGSCRLFGGLHALLQRLRATFPAPFTIALAPVPLAALVLARTGRCCGITSQARLASRLAPLPLALLRWPDEEQQRLRSMGVTTLGELLRLPRAGLARRLGPERLLALDRLLGRSADPRRIATPAERFAERVDPGFETADAGRLLAALTPALGKLEDFLRARQRGVAALRCVFVHRRGDPAVLVLRLVVPEYRAARFAALLAARLEQLALGGPVRRIELAAGRLRHLPGGSAALWRSGEHGGGTGDAVPEFLQTLMARLGERAVYGLALVPGHRPERQGRSVWPRFDAGGLPESRDDRNAGLTMPDYRQRPLGLLPAPVPVAVRQDAAGRTLDLRHAGQSLQLVSGPERIESGWWDGGDVARDYYVARAADGALWWVFRECGAARGWFVHGCFA